MADTLATKLQKTAESIYADEYLFHPHNAFFRGQVAPPHADDPTPAIPLATVLSFKCVQDVFDADGGADVSSAEKREEVLAAALQRSKVVEVLHDAKAAVAWRVRRRHALDVAKDPARRTIVLRPIPTAATLEELRNFLKPLKVKVEMMEMQAPRGANKSGPADSSARHGLCHVRLHTEAEAQAIISHYSAPASKKGGGSSSAAAARHDFGMAESSLAQHFLPPRIYATALHVYDAHQEIVQQRAADDQLQANIHKAQATLLKLSGEGTTRPARIAHVPGKTLLASGLPEGTTWQVAKAKLGHLLADAVAAGSATMKGGLRMVHVEPATSGTPCRAFIVCRDAAVANALVLRFSMASTEHAELREYFTAGLRVLTTAEESYVEQRLSVWMAGTPGKAAAKRTRE